MEMEHLTKQQIVLVALLVSFISSIASGIVTVSLLDQAPPAVTQTVNRVIEKTVERVVPDTSTGGSTVVKETVVVSEDEAVVKAIETANKSVVRVVSSSDSSASFLGFGVIASGSGDIIAHVPGGGGTYFAVLPTGVTVPIAFIKTDDDNGISLFRASSIANSIGGGKFADISKVKLGQKVVAIGGSENDSVASGIVSSIIVPNGGSEPFRVQTSIGAQVFAQNAVLINLSGEIVGLKVGSDVEGGFVTANIVRAILK